MANWFDVLALIVTLSVLGGIIYGTIFVSKQISQGVEQTKENLKSRGLTVTQKGVSVKTSKRFDRSDYVDATQRGFVKAMGAASFGKDNISTSQSSSKMQHRNDSQSSVRTSSSGEDKKKSSSFLRRNHHSSSKEEL